MTDNFIGKTVSIKCSDELGVFQGQIKTANAQKITLIKAFRNGVPLKKPEMEITIDASNIMSLELLGLPITSRSASNTPTPHAAAATSQPIAIAKKSAVATTSAMMTNGRAKNGHRSSPVQRTKPMEVPQQNGTTPYKNDRRGGGGGNGGGRNNGRRNNNNNRNSAFGTPVDDPTMTMEFDFEKNLALFDKQAIWDEIENGGEKPDLLRQTNFVGPPQGGTMAQQKKYRHDQNVISSKPIQFRQIQTEYKCQEEFVTDEGLIIPCIPRALRHRVQALAEANGFSWQRQGDILGRAAVELAMSLLGGARRLIPKNQHQWPTISIICDEPFNEKLAEVGLITGRQLASHGLKVMIYVKTATISERQSHELELYTATGNDFTCDVSELPASDLVILACTGAEPLPADLVAWLAASRSPILAIDPPTGGIKDVPIKCSLLPILPIEDVGTAGGKLYLANLTIPLKFFRDSGIKYSPPFGAKFVIPLHDVSKG